MLHSKAKRKFLAELKQLKIRQKCIEKSLVWPKLTDLEENELEFLKEVEKLKTANEKNSRMLANEAKSTALKCFQEIHTLIKTVSNLGDELPESRPSELLKVMADINVKLSENLYICNKELTSLKYQNDQC
jgi:hypothetical protein